MEGNPDRYCNKDSDKDTAEGGPQAQQVQVWHTDSKEARSCTSNHYPFRKGKVFGVVQGEDTLQCKGRFLC